MEPEHFCENCDECYFTDLGVLGSLQHVRCRACGWDQSWPVEQDDDDCDDDGRFSTDAEADEDAISGDGQPDEAQEWYDFDPDC